MGPGVRRGIKIQLLATSSERPTWITSSPGEWLSPLLGHLSDSPLEGACHVHQIDLREYER